MHSTNYRNTFITIADDSSVERGTMPPEKAENPSVASRTWRMIAEHPYRYTSDDVVFTVWADRQGISDADREAAREEFFSRGRACLRASDLGKKYGWGIHHDAEGRMALFGVESEEYRSFVEDEGLNVVKAMRSSRR